MKLSKLYHGLSKFYELLELSKNRLYSAEELAIVAILEEDLLSLLEECEEYLIGGQGLRQAQIQSFESRSFTVLEEIQALDFLPTSGQSSTVLFAQHLPV